MTFNRLQAEKYEEPIDAFLRNIIYVLLVVMWIFVVFISERALLKGQKMEWEKRVLRFIFAGIGFLIIKFI